MSTQLIVIIIYFAITVLIGVLSGLKSKGSDSFVGAQMGLLAIVCASTGEWLGGTATTGVSEYGFNFGLSGAWYTIANAVGTMFLGLCFAKLYRSVDSVTVPGIIQQFFGKKARTVSSALLIFVMLAVGLSQMVAAGKLGVAIMGLDFNVTCIIFAVIFIVYTLAGGMNAVAATNTLHLFVMYGGAILGVFMVISKIGGGEGFAAGWEGFLAGIEAVEADALANGASNTNYFGMFTIGGSKVSSWLIASLLGACTAQAGIQPVLAAKDVPTAKKACIITAFVVAPFGFATALLGMGAKVLSFNGQLLDLAGNNVVDGKQALFTLMMNLPGWAGGLILASLLAAILSTVSPIILSAGTMFTKDIYQGVLKKDASDKEVLFMGRLTTAISGVICCVAAMALVNASAVLDLVYAAYSLRGALFVVVLFGIYTKFASSRAAIWSMWCTGIVAVGWVAIKLVRGSYLIPGFSETYAAVIVAVVATIVFSMIFKPSAEEAAEKAQRAAALKEKMAKA